MAVHWYAPPNSASFLRWIDSIYAIYKLPIWVTEFAVADWNIDPSIGESRYSLNDVQVFMNATLPELMKRDYVQKFSWKTRSTTDVNMWSSALLNPDNSLTALGEIYAAFNGNKN